MSGCKGELIGKELIEVEGHIGRRHVWMLKNAGESKIGLLRTFWTLCVESLDVYA